LGVSFQFSNVESGMEKSGFPKHSRFRLGRRMGRRSPCSKPLVSPIFTAGATQAPQVTPPPYQRNAKIVVALDCASLVAENGSRDFALEIPKKMGRWDKQR
jgi:hypothetical protein